MIHFVLWLCDALRPCASHFRVKLPFFTSARPHIKNIVKTATFWHAIVRSKIVFTAMRLSIYELLCIG